MRRAKLALDIKASVQDVRDAHWTVPVLVSFPPEVRWKRCSGPQLKYKDIYNPRTSSWIVLNETQINDKKLAVVLDLRIKTRYDFLGVIKCSGEIVDIFGTVTLGDHCEWRSSVITIS